MIVQVYKPLPKISNPAGHIPFFHSAAAGSGNKFSAQELSGTDVAVIDKVSLVITRNSEGPADQYLIYSGHNLSRCPTQHVTYPDLDDTAAYTQRILYVPVIEIPDIRLRDGICFPEAAEDFGEYCPV